MGIQRPEQRLGKDSASGEAAGKCSPREMDGEEQQPAPPAPVVNVCLSVQEGIGEGTGRQGTTSFCQVMQTGLG